MPEHLRALFVLLIFGAGFFYAAKGALVQLIPEETHKRWRNVWVLVTLAFFLSHNILIYFLVFAAILLVYQRREAHIMGLYLVLIFAAPPAPAQIPGLGIIDHIWVLHHYRLLGIALLLPAAIALFQRSTTARLGNSPVDWMVLGYLCLMSLLAFREGNITSGFRTVISLWVDIFLPYYVASRSIRSEEGLKQAMTGYLIAAMMLSIVAIFEVFRSWKLYSAVLSALGLNELMFGGYLRRSGLLRPNAAVGNSIVLGYVLVVALGFYFYLKELLTRPLHRLSGMMLLSGGIVASLSRGPWVGAAFLVLTYLFLGPNSLKRLAFLILGAGISFSVLSVLPSGQLLIDMLPIVGTTEQGNVEYRANLLTSALPVISRNFFFGSYDYLDAPELQVMMQGEGIIDVVNSYVGVLLYSGVIGLIFYLGAFLCTIHQLRKSIRLARRLDSRMIVPGRALMATILAIMLIIYTVSSISAIPVVYWMVMGMSVAYAGVVSDRARQIKEAPLS